MRLLTEVEQILLMPSDQCTYTSQVEGSEFNCGKQVSPEHEYCTWHRPSDQKSEDEILERIEDGESPPEGSRLRNLRFEGHTFEGVNFERADFESTDFVDVNFHSCDLVGSRFYDGILTGVEFIDCSLDEVKFSGRAQIRDSLFKRGVNEGFELKSVRCEATDFKSFEVQDGSFYDTEIFGGECQQLTIRNSNMNLLEFRRVDLQNCTFDGGETKPLEFDGGSITSTSFICRNPSSFRFLGLNLFEVVLKGRGKADLEIKNCSETDMKCRLEDLGSLQTTAIEGDNLSILNGDIENLELKNVDVEDFRLDSVTTENCDLNDLDVNCRADMDGVVLKNGTMDTVSLSRGTLEDTTFESIDSVKLSINEGSLDEVHFVDGTHNRARLPGAKVENSEYRNVEFVNGSYQRAVIGEGTIFKNSSFHQVDFTEASLDDIDFNDTSFERSILRDCDFRKSTLSATQLYDTHMTDVRLNEDTDFGYRCAYEKEVDRKIKERSFDIAYPYIGRPVRAVSRLRHMWGSSKVEDSHIKESLEKAVRVYRDYQRILRENSLRDQIREYRVRERDAQRKLALADGEFGKWARLMGMRWSMKYGEGVTHIIATSVFIIFVWTFLFIISGGLRVVEADGPTLTVLDSNIIIKLLGSVLSFMPLSQDSVLVVTRNLYYSTVTFTTLGFGDIQPATQASRYLAAIESFLGAVLMALLVFVLGRRATW